MGFPSQSWACGAAGSALPWHGRGRRFDPDQVHQFSQRFESTQKTFCLLALAWTAMALNRSARSAQARFCLRLRSRSNECSGVFSTVSDSLQLISSGFGDRIARDRMGVTSARAAGLHPRLRLGCRSLPKLHIPARRLNSQLCIRPSTLAVRPILFGARGQRLFLCPQ
jgi:hypothetical protein